MSPKKPPAVTPVESIAVNISTAARMLGVRVWTMRTLAWSGKLAHFRLGNKIMFRPEDLRAFAEAQVRG